MMIVIIFMSSIDRTCNLQADKLALLAIFIVSRRFENI